MRHGNHKNHIGLKSAHRLSVLRNLSIGLITHGKLNSTEAKCKAVKPFVEKLITLAKTDSLANRRLVISRLNNAEATKILFETVAPKFKTRPGGYTRLYKLCDGRMGDGAKLGLLTLVE